MQYLLAIGVVVVLASPVAAQVEVERGPDLASWATMSVNPTLATIRAIRSEHPKCELARLAVSEAIGNVTVLTVKHFVVSPRPCLGCDNHGTPSGHSMNGALGFASGWRVDIGIGISLAAAVVTAGLRVEANRHTRKQVIAGLLIGAGADLAGRALVRCRD
jgi:hypothetical protein